MNSDDSQNVALFSSFLMGLASAAFIEMGVIEDPSTKKKRQDRDAAKQHIDLLCVLRAKTVGNLEPREKELLDRAISDLQIEFAKIFVTEKK